VAIQGGKATQNPLSNAARLVRLPARHQQQHYGQQKLFHNWVSRKGRKEDAKPV
jgi:hypothetical protein